MNEVVVVEDADQTRVRTNALQDVISQLQGDVPVAYQSETIAQPWTFVEGAAYTPFTLNRIGLSYGYMSYGLVQAVIDQPVEDAFRGGIEVETKELDEEDLALFHRAMEEAEDLVVAKNTLKWKRLYGGAGAITVTDQDPRTPMRPLKKGDTLKFLDADRWELLLTYVSQSGQPFSVDPNRPDMLVTPYNYYGIALAPSRVIRVVGKPAPSFIRQRLQGWGMSELERCMREINCYVKFQNLLFELVDEAKVDVYKVERFNDSLASAQGSALIALRVQMGNWLKNYKNALVIDKEDEYDQKQLAFSGLADIFEEFRISLCASLKIPYNKLFGQSATGFASGEDSMENYNAMIDSDVRESAKPLLREMIALRMLVTFGFIPEFTFKFKPLRVLNETEEELIRQGKQSRALELYDRDLLDGRETMESLHKNGLLNVESAVLEGKREPVSPLQMQAEAQDTAAKQGDAKLKLEEKKSRANGYERLANMIMSDRKRQRRAA